MTDDAPETVGVSLDDQVLFRLREGRCPVVSPDTVTRVSYELGISVIHTGTVWALGYVDGEEALELDDGTIVLAADIDPESFTLMRAES